MLQTLKTEGNHYNSIIERVVSSIEESCNPLLKGDALCSGCHQILVLRTPVPTTPQHVSEQATNRTLYFICGSPTNKMSTDEIWLASMVIYFPPQTFIVGPISWAFPRHILCLFWLYSLNYHTNCDLFISHQTATKLW